MSKCIICGKEVNKTYGNSNLMGVYCRSCATENHYTNEQLIEYSQQKIADLEAKLAECEKERELDNSFWKQECDGLQKALEEKTLTIEQINKAFIGNRSLWKGKYERANQDKISFALEQLELARRRIDRLRYNENKCLNKKDCIEDCLDEIDNQINNLKEEIKNE